MSGADDAFDDNEPDCFSNMLLHHHFRVEPNTYIKHQVVGLNDVQYNRLSEFVIGDISETGVVVESDDFRFVVI